MSSHEASTHHHHEEPRSKSSMSASFWFVIILVGLFVAALNFINVMGHEADGGHGTHNVTGPTEGHHEGTNRESVHEPTPNISNHGEASGAGSDSTGHAEGAHH